MSTLVDYAPGGLSLVREVFIETGTYNGDTLKAAAAAGYQELHSIEYLETKYQDAVELFRHNPRVHLHCGSSPELLPQIMMEGRPTTFWLDAHWCGGGCASGFDPVYGQCPLVGELQAIARVDWKNPPYILIDDAIMFTRKHFLPPFIEEQWPTIPAIRNLLPGYTLSQWADILFCLPDGKQVGKLVE